jgi:hypothetical protein
MLMNIKMPYSVSESTVTIHKSRITPALTQLLFHPEKYPRILGGNYPGPVSVIASNHRKARSILR